MTLVGITTATLSWSPAPGPVAAYFVYINRNGEWFPPYPEVILPPDQLSITVNAALGDFVMVRVAALDEDGQIGPWSAPSEVLRFVPPGQRTVALDVNGDEASEILLQHTETGALRTWRLYAPEPLRPFEGGTGGAKWDLVDTGDYDGNGYADVVWINPANRRLTLCLSDGRNATLCRTLFKLAPTATFQGAGDLDRDGRQDLLVRDPDQDMTIVCLGSEVGYSTCSAFAGLTTGWRVLAVGDADGDHKADLVFHHAQSGALVLCRMNGVEFVTCGSIGTIASTTEVHALPDARADGDGGLLLRTPGSTIAFRCALHAAVLAGCTVLVPVEPQWSFLGAGDYDGNGHTDVVWKDALTGAFRIDFLVDGELSGPPFVIPLSDSYRMLAR